MSFEEAIELLSEEEAFRATVYAMNTLLLRQGIYKASDFEALFCEHAENFKRGFKPRKPLEISRESAVAIP